MTCEYCHPYCRDCDGSRTHYISVKGIELVGCGCSGCCDRLGGSGPYLREWVQIAAGRVCAACGKEEPRKESK